MYFCPNCSYILDITKSSGIQNTDDEQRIIITKPLSIFKLLEDNVDLTNYKAMCSKEELVKNKKYSKLKNEEKKKIDELFEEAISSSAEFKCDVCNYSKNINETTLLYKISINDTILTNNTIEENELMTKNPILPHTRDYNCKNPGCITHKNNNIKDSIFYKEKNSFKVNYICCVCFYNW
jgi:hypothetical protein